MKDTTRVEGDGAPLWKRLAWMGAIWLASISLLGAIAMVIRWWLAP